MSKKLELGANLLTKLVRISIPCIETSGIFIVHILDLSNFLPDRTIVWSGLPKTWPQPSLSLSGKTPGSETDNPPDRHIDR